MVSLLIRMNLATLRRDIKWSSIFWAGLGILLALWTVSISFMQDIAQPVKVDLLASIFAVWMLMLALAPVFRGGSGGVRAEHLALLPIPPRKLAIGLMGIATISIGAAVVLLAFMALITYGFQLGVVAGMVSVLAVVLQFMVVVLLGRVVYGIMGQAMQTQLGTEVVAFQYGLFFAGISVGWFTIEPIVQQTDRLFAEGWPPAISSVFRLLPSGWGLMAIDAAGHQHWGIVIGVITAFLVLIGALLHVWMALFTRSLAGQTTSRIGHGGVISRSIVPYHWFNQTPVGGVVTKELKTWMRDPWRVLELRIALWTGVLTGFIPLIVGLTDVLPFVGFIIILMGGIVSANLYALDGSALWQTLLTPGAAQRDVRGRQWAWLLLFAPVSLGVTVVFTALSGHNWAWPLVLAALPAALGATSGLTLLFSILFPSPGIDPQHRRNPMDSTGGEIGVFFIIPIVAALCAAPAALISFTGVETENVLLQWTGISVGIITGIFFGWLFGWLAYQRLKHAGPELLHLMLKGAAAKVKPDKKAKSDEDDAFWEALPPKQKMLFRICQSLFWVPLLPQGLVPLAFKLMGSEAPSWFWFLALYLPAPWQWPVIVAMIALGSAMLYVAIQWPRNQRAASGTVQ